MKKNMVTRCLRCGGPVLPFSLFEQVPEDWGFSRWSMRPWNGVVCRACGLVYDDFGSGWNCVQVLRMLPPDICRRCGEKVDMSGAIGRRVECRCGWGYWFDELFPEIEGTYGWVKRVLDGRIKWKDEGKVYKEVK